MRCLEHSGRTSRIPQVYLRAEWGGKNGSVAVDNEMPDATLTQSSESLHLHAWTAGRGVMYTFAHLFDEVTSARGDPIYYHAAHAIVVATDVRRRGPVVA